MKHGIYHLRFPFFKDVVGLFEQHEKALEKYIDQLLWWNKRVNLVSRDVSRETVQKHVMHSIMVSVSQLYQESNVVIDAGSGGGLPGIPLSIVSANKKMVLNDVVSKKMMACKQMIQLLGLDNCSVETKSVENIKVPVGAVIVSKHAFKINDLVRLVRDKPWGGLVLLKGLNEVETELNEIKEKLNITIFSLEQGDNSFYDGKALVEITR